MTLDEMKASKDLFISPKEAADILKCAPSYIRHTAHSDPEKLGFPVVIVGTRTKIIRKKFLEYIGEAS